MTVPVEMNNRVINVNTIIGKLISAGMIVLLLIVIF
jgi:hypothetical protein